MYYKHHVIDNSVTMLILFLVCLVFFSRMKEIMENQCFEMNVKVNMGKLTFICE